jgi:hypothetical protein
MHMKRPMIWLSTACFAFAAQAAAGGTAADLVRAMRSDEIAVAGARHAFVSGALEQKYPRINASCVKRVPFADFTEGLSRVVGQVLTPTEIDGALKFYQSDAGVKFTDGLLRRLHARLGADSGLAAMPGTEEISPAQVAAISDFTSSDLGRKVMGKEMSESPAALQFGRDMMEQIAGKCGRK